MPIVHVSDPLDSRIDEYRNVSDGGLLRDRGLFVAEGRLVVRQLLVTSRLRTRSLLVTEAALRTLEDVVGDTAPFAVYVAPQPVMNGIVGFNIHRGCLALGVRPGVRFLEDLVGGWHQSPSAPQDGHATPDAGRLEAGRSPAAAFDTHETPGMEAFGLSRIVVLEGVSNVDNIGGIFRSVAALGGHAVVVGPGCGDPLYRKAIRTSIGATLRIPFASTTRWPQDLDALEAAGFTLVALTPDPGAERLEDVAADLRARPRVALIAGAEGDGLSAEALACADVRVRIPMAPGIDSINVATATALALYRIA
jgi:tRNA G18 (ribose-2'-O)-methylase SpoU